MSERKIITAEPDSFFDYFRKLWQYRNLIWVFAKRDLKVKYSQTLIGVGWTILQPLTAIILYSFFFGYLLNLDAGNVPFVLYVTSGLLAWNFFTYIVYQGTSSTQEAAHVIKKIYFPKAVLALSKVGVALIELSISLFLIVPLFIWFGILPTWRLLFLPLAILLTALNALTLVFWISALAYRQRDLMHIVPYLVYFGIWVTPVFFTSKLIPEPLIPLMFVNPMAAVVEFWRWCIFPDYEFSPTFLFAIGFNLILGLIGFGLFSKNESKFSDFA